MMQVKDVNDAVLYESAKSTTILQVVEEAVCAGANLAGADLDGAYLAGANLARANLAGANLARAYLAGANLARANLDGANLARAYLAGATYGDNVPCTRPPLQILGSRYAVLIFDSHIKIGCELHSIDEWRAYGQRQIEAMDGDDAWTWWLQYRDTILAMADARRYRHQEMEGRGNDPDQKP